MFVGRSDLRPVRQCDHEGGCRRAVVGASQFLLSRRTGSRVRAGNGELDRCSANRTAGPIRENNRQGLAGTGQVRARAGRAQRQGSARQHCRTSPRG
jgi:hypothetical protein